jgi:hypothetical protein
MLSVMNEIHFLADLKSSRQREFLVLTSFEMIDDHICYFNYLILDRNIFEAGQKEMESNGIMTDAIRFMSSYQERSNYGGWKCSYRPLISTKRAGS